VTAINATITTPGTGQWTSAERVWKILATLRGAGGNGRATPASTGAGGGGGGALSQSNLRVLPSTAYDYSLGDGGNPGGDTWLVSDTTLLAKGGSTGAASISGAAGGAAGSGVGDTKFSGGNGGTGNASGGGGGGEGARTGANGANGSNGSGATGGAGGTGGDGADGGAGGNNGLVGQPGTAPGGGGGGSGEGGPGGGAGARGQIDITSYQKPASAFQPPRVTNLVHCFDMKDIDGDGTMNAAYADGALITSVWNMGSGGNLVRTTGGNAGTDPKLAKAVPHPCLQFDSNFDAMEITGSATSWGAITSNQPFDLWLCVQTGVYHVAHFWLGNASQTDQEGFQIGLHTVDRGEVDIIAVRVGGAVKWWNGTNKNITPGRKQILRWTSDGTTWSFSIDGGSAATISSLGTAGTGTMTRNVRVGCTSLNGANANFMAMNLFKLMFYDAQLSAGDATDLLAALEADEGMD